MTLENIAHNSSVNSSANNIINNSDNNLQLHVNSTSSLSYELGFFPAFSIILDLSSCKTYIASDSYKKKDHWKYQSLSV